MPEPDTPKSLAARRGLLEDIFLYLIVAVVISFTSWFLISTQNDIMKSLPKPEDVPTQTFLTLLEKHEREPRTAGSDDASAASAEERTIRLNPNYLAYLQAQANLNKKRYDMGSQLILANMTRKNVGFLIGTLICLIGCVIIVRRIRNMSVTASGTISGQQFSLLTASPGVLLVVLGSVMVIATILRTDDVYVHDFEPISPFVVATDGKKVDETLKKETEDALKKLEQDAAAIANKTNAAPQGK